MNYQTVIGLEVHIQLKTKSKLFSSAPTTFGANPNSQANLVDLAYPGTLPVLNREAVEQAIVFGLAINAHIEKNTFFARKNYFYPDLPKGYQTSQSDKPIVGNGTFHFNVDDQKHSVHIVRAHLEEDAGKSLHDFLPNSSAIDLNRAGCPLLEIVTAPDFSNAKEVVAYLKTLHRLVKMLDICDGNMQEGSFRVDVNLSLKPIGSDKLGTRCEIKNINSFRFIEKAIEYETQRQAEILDAGGKVRQQTRLFQESTGQTIAMRDKEDSHDYRYFPCPDLKPLEITSEWIERIRNTRKIVSIEQVEKQLIEEYGLPAKETSFFLDNTQWLSYLNDARSHLTQPETSSKALANFVLSECIGLLNKNNQTFEDFKAQPKDLAQIINRLSDQTLSSKTAKQALALIMEGHTDVDALIQQHNLKQVSDVNALSQAIDAVILKFPSQFQEFLSGKDKILGFLVGQVMKETKGTGDPAQIDRLFREKLNS
ncbi:MAG: Asp-tRNA(Asn)/Glu-tRNA(Gln) amidotransferase subunit GatB [Gammaproteobacteria bacterium]|nr:Asp-tRNA(Asn)/Glu-tRNA(Gln) amidotransferase subunit GatB [Gammaproteobacteria bacterium]